MDSSEIPSPLAEVTDTLEHDPNAVEDAITTGLFSYDTTKSSLGTGNISDCPYDGQVVCPHFKRTKIAADGTITVEEWIYLPIQKKWVSLFVPDYNDFKLPNFNFSASSYFDGTQWATSRPNLAPKAQPNAAGPWLYSYGSGGNIEYQLYLKADSLSDHDIEGTGGAIAYPSNAKTISFVFEQQSGVNYILGKDLNELDETIYPNVATLRSTHITTDSPFCLKSVSRSTLVYFDSQYHAAGFAKGSVLCDTSITDFGGITPAKSGVITLADRAVILLQIPDSFFGSYRSVRENRIVAAIGLDASGKSEYGVAYFPGFTFQDPTLYRNEAAFKAWLNTITTDVEAHTLP